MIDLRGISTFYLVNRWALLAQALSRIDEPGVSAYQYPNPTLDAVQAERDKILAKLNATVHEINRRKREHTEEQIELLRKQHVKFLQASETVAEEQGRSGISLRDEWLDNIIKSLDRKQLTSPFRPTAPRGKILQAGLFIRHYLDAGFWNPQSKSLVTPADNLPLAMYATDYAYRIWLIWRRLNELAGYPCTSFDNFRKYLDLLRQLSLIEYVPEGVSQPNTLPSLEAMACGRRYLRVRYARYEWVEGKVNVPVQETVPVMVNEGWLNPQKFVAMRRTIAGGRSPGATPKEAKKGVEALREYERMLLDTATRWTEMLAGSMQADLAAWRARKKYLDKELQRRQEEDAMLLARPPTKRVCNVFTKEQVLAGIPTEGVPKKVPKKVPEEVRPPPGETPPETAKTDRGEAGLRRIISDEEFAVKALAALEATYWQRYTREPVTFTEYERIQAMNNPTTLVPLIRDKDDFETDKQYMEKIGPNIAALTNITTFQANMVAGIWGPGEEVRGKVQIQGAVLTGLLTRVKVGDQMRYIYRYIPRFLNWFEGDKIKSLVPVVKAGLKAQYPQVITLDLPEYWTLHNEAGMTFMELKRYLVGGEIEVIERGKYKGLERVRYKYVRDEGGYDKLLGNPMMILGMTMVAPVPRPTTQAEADKIARGDRVDIPLQTHDPDYLMHLLTNTERVPYIVVERTPMEGEADRPYYYIYKVDKNSLITYRQQHSFERWVEQGPVPDEYELLYGDVGEDAWQRKR